MTSPGRAAHGTLSLTPSEGAVVPWCRGAVGGEGHGTLLPTTTGGLIAHDDERCRKVPRFLTILYNLVSDQATDKIVSWTKCPQSGNASFTLWDSGALEKQIFPGLFKHRNFTSFVRQLNSYQFKKVEPTHWTFAHPFFQRDQPDLLIRIKRKQSPRRRTPKGPDGNPANPLLAAGPVAGLNAALGAARLGAGLEAAGLAGLGTAELSPVLGAELGAGGLPTALSAAGLSAAALAAAGLGGAGLGGAGLVLGAAGLGVGGFAGLGAPGAFGLGAGDIGSGACRLRPHTFLRER